jgi:DNA helicase II / ATP-dependent DNA helicase PcrA
MNNLVLAVAGGRKTQSIVRACAEAKPDRKLLVLGYTRTSQDELEQRITAAAPFKRNVEVLGWYAFLLRHFVRPYLPLKYPGHRLTGLNFDGEPISGFYAGGASRYLDVEDRAYKLHLSKLALDVASQSNGAVIDRLQHIYDEIYVDEVQDLGGHDLDIVESLFRSNIDIHLVGDMRQALLSTNVRDPRHKKYRFARLIDWFRLQEKGGLLRIEERPETYRSNQTIADSSDTIFASSHQYSPTVSCSTEAHEHSGMFAVARADIAAYRAGFDPLCLRHGANSGGELDLPYVTFGNAKGRTVQHVLIYPTDGIRSFLTEGKELEGRAACALYIAVTRAQHSVGFILDTASSRLECWVREPASHAKRPAENGVAAGESSGDSNRNDHVRAATGQSSSSQSRV